MSSTPPPPSNQAPGAAPEANAGAPGFGPATPPESSAGDFAAGGSAPGTAPPPRPRAPPRPASGAASHARSLAQEGIERLYEAMPHVRKLNARITAWVAQTSWWRLALIGFVMFVATGVIGSILGVDDPVVVEPGGAPKDVRIDVHNDNQGVVITPIVGGHAGKPIEVPKPSIGDDDDSDKKSDSAAEKSHGIDVDDHGLRFEKDGKRFTIDDHGVHVVTLPPVAPTAPASPAVPAAPGEPGAPSGERGTAQADAERSKDDAARLKADAERKKQDADELKARDEQFKAEVASAISDAKEELQDSITEQIQKDQRGSVKRREDFAFWGLLKVILTIFFAYLVAVKVSSNNKRRADAMVRDASEVAEQQSLQRQLLEARLQTMQAQVEPHFLFNTLASVDYLIETDPARASTMQKNLIQYLRAAMPQMREAATQLGREIELCRAYLEILKVRMEERLQVVFAIPDGLRSADFPPMMLQSMVENAIKHGLEPKAEGGSLTLAAEIIDGDLQVTVADTGLGFSPTGASTSGGGIGLTNIRERLQLMYGGRARLEIAANTPSGTRASIVIPYQPVTKRANPARPTPFTPSEKTS